MALAIEVVTGNLQVCDDDHRRSSRSLISARGGLGWRLMPHQYIKIEYLFCFSYQFREFIDNYCPILW